MFYPQTSIPVPSTVAGVIEELLAEDGSTVEAGAQLCKIRVGGEETFPLPSSDNSRLQWKISFFIGTYA